MSLIDGMPRDEIQEKANFLLQMPQNVFNSILNSWEMGISIIWDAPNPQDILDRLGIHGPELFQLSSQLAVFLESQKPGSTDRSMAKIKPFTVVDGKIVITVEE